MKMLSHLRTTVAAFLLAAALIQTSALTNIDLVKFNLKLLNNIEQHEIDDIFAGLVLIFAGLAVDRVLSERRKKRQAEEDALKLRTLQATMRTVQDIVNNFLNGMLLLQLELPETVSPEVRELLDALTRDTHDRLTALGRVALVRETKLASGAGIDYAYALRSGGDESSLQMRRA